MEIAVQKCCDKLKIKTEEKIILVYWKFEFIAFGKKLLSSEIDLNFALEFDLKYFSFGSYGANHILGKKKKRSYFVTQFLSKLIFSSDSK